MTARSSGVGDGDRLRTAFALGCHAWARVHSAIVHVSCASARFAWSVGVSFISSIGACASSARLGRGIFGVHSAILYAVIIFLMILPQSPVCLQTAPGSCWFGRAGAPRLLFLSMCSGEEIQDLLR